MGGQQWIWAKTKIFSQVVLRPLGMLKQLSLAHFEPVVTPFGPWKLPKWAVLGPKMRQHRVNNAFFEK